MSERAIIGIVGGVGPYAGLDLKKKIFDQTLARCDQEHLTVLLWSQPEAIPDRTEFLLGRVQSNPAVHLTRIIMRLGDMGAGVIGIPCNTAHAPEIFDEMIRRLRQEGSAVEIVHLIRETAAFVRAMLPRAGRIGVLATDGTVRSGVYGKILSESGLQAVYPDPAVQAEQVQASIYDRDFGIKAHADPVTQRAADGVLHAVTHLITKGVDAVILGCTELPLALRRQSVEGTPIVDPNLILARALIRRVAPEKLQPMALAVSSPDRKVD